jgi:hypothetical protein
MVAELLLCLERQSRRRRAVRLCSEWRREETQLWLE